MQAKSTLVLATLLLTAGLSVGCNDSAHKRAEQAATRAEDAARRAEAAAGRVETAAQRAEAAADRAERMFSKSVVK